MVLCLHVRFFFYYYVWWCDICVCNVWWCDICVLCLTWFSVYMCGFFFYLHIHQPHHVFFFGIFFFFFLVSCPRYRKRATSRHLKTRLNNPLERRKNSFFFSFLAEVHKTGLLPNLWPLKTWLWSRTRHYWGRCPRCHCPNGRYACVDDKKKWIKKSG